MSLAKQFNTRPLYQQVADEFISRIVRGTWLPGQVIESEIEVARTLQVSLGTVRKAFDILVERELLLRQQGRGTVVADPVTGRCGLRLGRIRDQSGRKVVGDIAVAGARLELPSGDAARSLDINERTLVLAFVRQRRHEGRLYAIEDVFLRVDSSVHAMSGEELEMRARSRWGGYDVATGRRELVRPERCSAADAEAFGIEAGFPVLCLERVILSYQNRPLELSYGRCHLGTELRYEGE